MTRPARPSLANEADFEAWCLVADVRMALRRGLVADDAEGLVDCLRSHVRRIDELWAELEASTERIPCGGEG